MKEYNEDVWLVLKTYNLNQMYIISDIHTDGCETNVKMFY